VILSDVDIRKELAAGRVRVDPFDEDSIQPSQRGPTPSSYYKNFSEED
jgi:hypothetical protein